MRGRIKDGSGDNTGAKRVHWPKKIFKLIPYKRLTIGRKVRSLAAKRKEKRQRGSNKNVPKSQSQTRNDPYTKPGTPKKQKIELKKKDKYQPASWKNNKIVKRPTTGRKKALDTSTNKSDVVPTSSSGFGKRINDGLMTKSMEPRAANQARQSWSAKEKQQKNGNATAPAKQDWSENKNGPVRITHSENIDFSGTGGSSNLSAAMNRKQILTNLLDSGKLFI